MSNILHDVSNLIRVLDGLAPLPNSHEQKGVTPKWERPRCGARCRDGHACQAPVVWDRKKNRPINGRCRMHGGLSSGPKTLEGRARAMANLRQYREKRGLPAP